MNPELIVSALINHASIIALVGTRRALGQLPQNTAMPALVYQVINADPRPNLNYASGAQRAQARIQFNPLAITIPEVKAIHAALRSVLDFKHNSIVAGKLIVSCRFDLLGPMDKDNEAGIWTQPADYILAYYE
jgi:hypothetical protein